MSSSNPSAPAAADPAPQEQVATLGSDKESPATNGRTTKTRIEESMDGEQNRPTVEAATVATPIIGGATPAELDKGDINTTKPEDFDGEVSTTSELPSAETIKKIENYIILDRDGKSRKFKSLYNRRNVARRVLVIFIRHFFCGVCRSLTYSLL